MSKTTKIIAALGVVAGLGVAALPAFTYAYESVSGNVDVLVDVNEAIAMSIVGNYDTEGTYGNVKIKSAEVDSIAGVDVSQYVTSNAATSASHVSMLPSSVIHGGTGTGEELSFKSTINVYTNANKYNISVEDADSTTALQNTVMVDDDDDPSTPDVASVIDTIPAGIPESGDTTFDLEIDPTTAAWGYRVNTEATPGTDVAYLPMPAHNSGANLYAQAQASSSTTTTVYYGVATKGTQKTGTYKDTIIYTATTAN